ncbi:MAG: hypothetical protein G3I10_05445 [Ferrovum sp.]|nr:hypothetical protein [Ferrovum sp.]
MQSTICKMNLCGIALATYPVSHNINLQWYFDPLGKVTPYIGAGVT